MFKDTLDEGEKTKAEYQAKLLEATEEVRVLKSDNTALKERIDILYKLAKSYLDRFEPSTSDRTPEQEKKVVISDEVEVLEDSRSTTPSLNAWTKSKVRGFKKTSPLSPNTEQEQIEDNGSSNVMQDIQPHQVNDQSRKTSDSPDQTSDSNSVRSYSHLFSNYGYCAYEQRTKNKCKFEHLANVPVCQNGTACTLFKCMFKHPNSDAQKKHFLGLKSNPSQSNPWQVMPVWWGPNQGINNLQYPNINPWMFLNQNQQFLGNYQSQQQMNPQN